MKPWQTLQSVRVFYLFPEYDLEITFPRLILIMEPNLTFLCTRQNNFQLNLKCHENQKQPGIFYSVNCSFVIH